MKIGLSIEISFLKEFSQRTNLPIPQKILPALIRWLCQKIFLFFLSLLSDTESPIKSDTVSL